MEAVGVFLFTHPTPPPLVVVNFKIFSKKRARGRRENPLKKAVL